MWWRYRPDGWLTESAKTKAAKMRPHKASDGDTNAWSGTPFQSIGIMTQMGWNIETDNSMLGVWRLVRLRANIGQGDSETSNGVMGEFIFNFAMVWTMQTRSTNAVLNVAHNVKVFHEWRSVLRAMWSIRFWYRKSRKRGVSLVCGSNVQDDVLKRRWILMVNNLWEKGFDDNRIRLQSWNYDDFIEMLHIYGYYANHTKIINIPSNP